MRINFQVADVKKLLISVHRISELNYTRFGPGEKDSFIENIKTGNRIYLQKKGVGSYVMKVKFVDGEETEIIVDSGAEESVCPLWWGKKFGLFRPNKWLNLVNASGKKIVHHLSLIHISEPTRPY